MIESKLSILCFGHLPKHIGGRQYTGLATVVWNLANEFNKLDSGNKILLASTDIYVDKTKIEATEIIGWTKKTLIKYCIQSPWNFIQLFSYALSLSFNYRYPLINTLGKLVFFDYTMKSLSDDVTIINSHDITNSLIINHLSALYKKKLVVTIHGIFGNDANIKNWKINRKIEQKISSSPTISYITFISSLIKEEWSGLYDGPIAPSQVILNCADTNFFHYIPALQVDTSSNISLVTIGSISDRKGQKRVLDAICLLPREIRLKLKYSVIGNGTNQDIIELQNIAKENNLSFEYLGYLEPSQILSQLHTSDYMILPSSSEGFGLVYLESIACGTPVIIPKDLPIALEENILNDKNSILLEDFSSNSIRNCLLEIKKSSYSRKEISETLSKLSWNNIALQYLNLYQRL